MLISLGATTLSDVRRGEYQLGQLGSIQNYGSVNDGGCGSSFNIGADQSNAPPPQPMFYYSGAGNGGSEIRIYGFYQVFLTGNTTNQGYGMMTISLPTSPVGGISNWSGSATATFVAIGQQPNNPPPVLSNVAVSFSINFLPGDFTWFQGTYSVVLPGGCNLSNDTYVSGQPIPLVGTRTGYY